MVAAGSPLPQRERESLTGLIAFVSERDGNREVYTVLPSGQGERRLTRSPNADYPAAASPDATKLVVVSVEERSPINLEQLVLYGLADGSGRPVGPPSRRSRHPSWGPQGTWFVFESGSASFADLFRLDLRDSSLRRLTTGTLGNFEPVVSPDGKQVAFASSRDGDSEIYVMAAEGGRERRLTAFHRDDWSPLFSPDGKQLAFLSTREWTDRLFLMSADGKQQRRATKDIPSPSKAPPIAEADPNPQAAKKPRIAEADPSWSPDGKRIAFTVRPEGGKARVWILVVASGQAAPLFGEEAASSYNDDSPAWSPDGRHLVFVSDRDGDTELYIARADGSAVSRLTQAAGADWLPRWIAPRGSRR